MSFEVSEVTAYIALGSNLGSRLHYLRAAATALEAHPKIHITGYSHIYETAPVGGPAGQGAFLNAVIRLNTTLTARELLDTLLSIERVQGRQRIEQWGPRTLDLDLLLFGEEVIHDPDLTIPHPRSAERNFVLVPLCNLAPDLIIPGYTHSVKELATKAGNTGVEKTSFRF